MRKNVFILAAAALLFAGCAKEAAEKFETVSYNTTISAVIDGVDTKAALADEGTFTWQEGDKIAVYTSAKVFKEFTLTDGAGTNKAHFGGNLEAGETVTGPAVYPVALAPEYVSATEVKVTLPDSYTYEGAQTNVPMTGTLSNSVLAFKQVGGVVKFSVTGIPDDATKLVVSAKAASLTGTYSTKNSAAIVAKEAESSTVTINFTKTADAMDFYLPVPTGTFSNLGISVRKADDTVISEKVASVNNEITRGKLLLMPAVAVVTEGNIANAEQLKTFLSAATTEDTKSYRLVADIDCAGNTLPAAAGFGGVFDGQSHKVFNFKVSVDGATTGLFLSNAGTIKNVIFGSKDGESYDGVSEIAAVEGKGGSFTGLVADNNGTLENITTFVTVNFKAVAASAEVGVSCLAGHAGATSVIKNCVNKATLNASGTPTQYVDMGTIVGFMDKAGATVSGCSNEAKQTITLEVKKVLHIGGVIGRINGVVTVEDCHNKADIAYDQKVKPSTWMSIGAVIGSNYNGGIITGCSNKGAISANTLQVVRIGGIMGVLNKSGEVRNCVNEGTVTLTQEANTNWQSAGGIIGFQEASKGTVDAPVLDNIIVGNTNKGAVTVTVENTTTHANKVAAGGILGEGSRALSVKDNTNTAAVKVTNKAAGPVYAGGIYGALIKNPWAIETSGNVNTGAVSASTSDNAAAMAGGVIGYIAPLSGSDANTVALTLSLEKNTGAVTCANTAAAGSIAGNNASGTLDKCIAGGSVNGTALTAANLNDLVQGSGSKGTVTGTIPVFSENLADGYFTYHNKKYNVVKMKDGKWWMAQNLAYLPAGKTAATDLKAVTAGVFAPIRINADQTAAEFTTDAAVVASNGYLYQAECALGLEVGAIKTLADAVALEGAQGLCPTGWHVPTFADIQNLVGKIPQQAAVTTPYFSGSECYMDALNADGFNMAAFGAVIIQDNTKTSGTFMGYMAGYKDHLSSGMFCGSSVGRMNNSDTPTATYNTAGDPTSGIKNLQFYGFMPMTNMAESAKYTCNGTKVSYRIAAPLRCVRDKSE